MIRIPITIGCCLVVSAAMAAGPLTGSGIDPVRDTAPRDSLVLAGPPSVVSFPLFRMAEAGALMPWTRKVTFQFWTSGEQLRALLANQQADFAAVPVHMPANLQARGVAVKLVSVSAWGVHWLVSSDPAVHSLDDLKGQELVVPLRREMPGILIDELMRARNWKEGVDLKIVAVRDFQAAANMLLTGRSRHALLAEPSVAALFVRLREQHGVKLYRAQSLRQAWAESFPKQPEVPQSGLMASSRSAEDQALTQAVGQAYAQSAQWCKAHVADCAELAHRYLPQMPVAALAEAIAHSPLDVRPASQVRSQLEAFYRLVSQRAPELIGGRMPSEAFYQP